MIQQNGFERLRFGQGLYLFLILGLILLLTSGLTYTYWDPSLGGRIEKLVSLLLFAYFLYILPNIEKYRYYKIVLLLTFLPFVSIVNSYSIYGQPPLDSIVATSSNFIWLIYFPLKRFRVRESTILYSLLITAIAILLIQVVQQFTYPKAVFGVVSEELMNEKGGYNNEMAEMRNGLWRFRMHQNGFFTAPIIFAILIWLKRKIRMSMIVLITVLLVSIYLSLTRQVIFSVVMTIFLSFFIVKEKGHFRSFVIGASLIIFLIFFYNELFSDMSQKTQAEVREQNIRLLAATYFIEDFSKTLYTFLFGYGNAAGAGAFNNYTDILMSEYGFFISDVGFIGKIWQYGIIYVFVCYYLLYILFFKYKRQIPLYVRLFVMFTVFMSPMIFPFYRNTNCFVWAMLLYVCELHISNSPLRMRSST